jgi:hypothetical protein
VEIKGELQMAIVARTQAMTQAEQAAVIKHFKENSALDPQYETSNANAYQDYFERWGVVIDAESLATAFQKLSEAGVLKLRSEAQRKYDAATKGYSQSHQDVLDVFLKRSHLVCDPTDDRTYENCTAFFNAMQGRDWNESNLNWCRDYLVGKGIKLHFDERPTQRTDRGHIPTSPDDFRFAPKSDSNHTPLSRHSHSSDRRFNGQAEREKMKRPGQQEEDLMAATWFVRAKSLVGQTHSESQRIQDVVQKTPGGWKAAYEAGLAEQRRIENERARGR